MRSKSYQAIKEKVPSEAVDISAAVSFLKENARRRFDETVEVHINLDVDPSKSDQLVRGTVSLPAGAAKQQKIVVFTDDVALRRRLAGDGVAAGGEELIDQIVADGALDADATMATPEMMPKVAKAARILGPRGLMPNPKAGTVSSDPVGAVRDLRSGRISFKADQQGNIHAAVGKVSWDASSIVANIREFIKAVKAARPPAVAGQLIRSVSLASTMGPAIRVTDA